MRSDVNKILTECYKEGPHDYKFPRRTTAKIFDEVGGKVGIRYEHTHTPKHGTKSFGENLSYLPRFLKANVGRKWNDIYSDICKNFDRRSTVNDHIFQHLFDYFVEAKNVITQGGELYEKTPWGGPVLLQRRGNKDLYVGPGDGILKYIPVRPKTKATWELEHERVKARKRTLSKFQELHQMDNDQWMVFTLSPVGPDTVYYQFPELMPPYDSGAWAGWFERKKAFVSLPQSEKQRFGVRTVVKFKVGTLVDKVPFCNQSQLVNKGSHYYASMRSASKKELRAVGL